MGLDVVELILEVERSFQIQIPDHEAGGIRTVADLIASVERGVQTRSRQHCPTSRTFYRIRRHLMERLAIRRGSVRPDSRIRSLIPRRRHRRAWTELRATGLQLPALEVSTIVVVAIVLLGFGLAHRVAASVDSFVIGLIAALSTLVAVPAALFPLIARVGGRIPSSIITVRDAVLMATQLDCGSNDEIAHRVRLMVSNQLGVPIEKVTERASFTEGFGAD